MDKKIDRRNLLIAGGSAMIYPRAARAGTERALESNAEKVSIGRLEMSPEAIAQAIEETVTSLAEGVSTIRGRKVNPRESGFKYHENLLRRYAKSLDLPKNLPVAEIVTRVKQHLTDKRIKIFPVTEAEIDGFQKDGEMQLELRKLARGVTEQDVAPVVYLSPDRTTQKIYMVRKIGPDKLQFLESYPDSTSKAEPAEPGKGSSASYTRLGIFSIPFKGVRLALLGEVTKVERPDLTRHFFELIDIDGTKKPFVRNFDRSEDNEIVTVTGDTHLLWSPEIEGIGIKIHDTTELDDMGKPASSGCIRTPSARRLTLMTLENKNPTQVLVYWADHSGKSNERGWGGSFDVKRASRPEEARPRRGKKKYR